MTSFQPVRLDDWIRGVDAETQSRWLIEDFIANDSLTLLSGPPKKLGKKTLFAMWQALLLARGQSYQALHIAQPVPVLYCYHESARRATRERFRLIFNGLGFDEHSLEGRFWFSHRSLMDLRNRCEVDDIGTWCRDHQIGLVIFDTLAKSMLGDEDSAENMGRVIRGVETARSYGMAVLILHHVIKAGASLASGCLDPDRDLRGSSALAGAYETHQAVRQYSYNVRKHDLLVQNKDGAEFAHKIWWEFRGEGAQTAAILHMGQRTPWDDVGALEPEDIRELLQHVSPGNNFTGDMLAALWKVGKHTAQEILAKLVAQNCMESAKYGFRLKEGE